MTEMKVLADFTPHLGEAFTIPHEDGSLYSLALIAADPLLPHLDPVLQRAPFDLRFEGPGTIFLPQGTYRLTNAGMGPQDIFLTPVGIEGGCFLYQAVFS